MGARCASNPRLEPRLETTILHVKMYEVNGTLPKTETEGLLAEGLLAEGLLVGNISGDMVFSKGAFSVEALLQRLSGTIY